MKPALNSEKYLRYLNSKGGHPTCPICETDGWTFIEEKNQESYAFVKTDRDNPTMFDASVAFVALLVCRNCGFVAPVLRERVADWIDENPHG